MDVCRIVFLTAATFFLAIGDEGCGVMAMRLSLSLSATGMFRPEAPASPSPLPRLAYALCGARPTS